MRLKAIMAMVLTLSVMMTMFPIAISESGVTKAYVTPEGKVVLENPLIKVVFNASIGARVESWIVKATGVELSFQEWGAGPPWTWYRGILANRIASLLDANGWFDGWPSEIGSSAFSYEILGTDGVTAKVKFSCTCSHPYIAGLKVDKIVTIYDTSQILDAVYELTNTGTTTISSPEGKGLFLTVQSTTNFMATDVYAEWMLEGTIYRQEPYVGGQFMGNVQWAYVINPSMGYVVGMTRCIGNVDRLWLEVQPSGHSDVEFVFEPFILQPGESIVYKFSVYGGPTPIPVTIPATIDIDPNTLNLKSNGEFVTAYIELPTCYYNVADIDLATVSLDGIPAVTDPTYGFVTDPNSYLMDHDGDGILERMVKFGRATVRTYLTGLPDYEEAPKFYDITLTVTGKLLNGTPFEGSDTITVLKK